MDANTFTSDDRKPVEYEAPEVTDYGKLTDITAATKQTGNTDRAFPVGTPIGDITFS
jgi:hypothetical protein